MTRKQIAQVRGRITRCIRIDREPGMANARHCVPLWAVHDVAVRMCSTWQTLLIADKSNWADFVACTTDTNNLRNSDHLMSVNCHIGQWREHLLQRVANATPFTMSTQKTSVVAHRICFIINLWVQIVNDSLVHAASTWCQWPWLHYARQWCRRPWLRKGSLRRHKGNGRAMQPQ